MRLLFVTFAILAVILSAAQEAASQSEGCVCAAIYQPVVGSDGKTYSNACAASCAGVSVQDGGSNGPSNPPSDYFKY